MFFIKFGKCLAIIPSNILPFPSSPLLGFPYLHGVFHRSLKLCSFVLILFSFCSSDSIILINLSLRLLILFLACSNLLLRPFNDYFISVTFFNSRISIWFFFFFLTISIFLLIYSICKTLFSYFSLVFKTWLL